MMASSPVSPTQSCPPEPVNTLPSAVQGQARLEPHDSNALLAQIMPVARLALWEAWDEPLELISLQFGRAEKPTLPLETSQMEAGAPWNENVYPGDRETL